MTSEESSALSTVCNCLQIQILGMRFGTTPEFTSKILSLLCFHHSNNVLAASINRMRQKKSERPGSANDATNDSDAPTHLHVIAQVPLSTADLRANDKSHDETQWALVRVVVCTLWRSRLISSEKDDSDRAHRNTLHLICADNQSLTLNEDDFVRRLASQHKAAPTEHQILQAITSILEEKSQRLDESKISQRKALSRVLKRTIKMAEGCPLIGVILADKHDPRISKCDFLTQQFYNEEKKEQTVGQSVALVLDLDAQPVSVQPKFYSAICKAAKKLAIPVQNPGFAVPECRDALAATIIAVQHFCYQKRLFLRGESGLRSQKRKRKHSGWTQRPVVLEVQSTPH